MEKVLLMESKTRKQTKEFAEALGITRERAAYINSMKEIFICWEHDYIKNTPEVD